MKASVKLVKALVGLAVSVVLSIGVCLAWFSTNNKVDGDGASSTLSDINISKFTVTAYNLKKSAEGVDADGNGYIDYEILAADDSGSFVMKPYGNLDGLDTAVLLKFTYDFKMALGKDYGIFVQYAKTLFNEDNAMVSRNEGDATYEFKCDLSSAVGFYGAQVSSGTARRLAKVDSVEENKNLLNLNGGAATDGEGATREFYCIVDYVETNVEELYTYVLDELNGSLMSQMKFVNDMGFYMAEV